MASTRFPQVKRIALFIFALALIHSVHAARLLNTNNQAAIPGSFIVVLNDDADLTVPVTKSLGAIDPTPVAPVDPRQSLQQLAEGIAESSGAKVARVFYGSALKGFALDGVPDIVDLASLLTDARINFVEPAVTVHLASTVVQNSAPWHLDRIDQPSLPLDSLYSYDILAARGVVAYVFDSGITVLHSEFDYGQRVLEPVMCLGSCVGHPVNDVSGYPLGYPDSGDCFGHGTAVAAVLGGNTFGVAKGVTFQPYIITDCSGASSINNLLTALNDALDNVFFYTGGVLANPTIFNLSIGVGGTSSSLEQVINHAISVGVVVVAAAGNDHEDACQQSPTDNAGVITVGGSQIDDQAWWVSTTGPATGTGPCVALFAPAKDIVSASNQSLTGSTVPLSGTSLSAGIVSGIAATYLETHSGASPAAVKAAIVQNATPGKLSGYGFVAGSPNLLAYSMIPLGAQIPSQTPRQARDSRTSSFWEALSRLIVF